jgi:hypothetical protein
MMSVSKCPNCGLPMESSNYFARGMAIKCRNCNYSGLPVNSGACLYDKVKLKQEEPEDAFKNELSLEALSSKLALASFFVSFVSLASIEMRVLTMASFVGFIMFSIFYAFFRLKNN